MENSISHTYHIGGMSCGSCATTVKNKLSETVGVTSVKVDLAKKEAKITSSEEITIETLQKALSNTGYSIAVLNESQANVTQKDNEKKQQPGHWADGSVVHSPEIHRKPHFTSDIDGSGIGSINTGPVTAYEE
jgi:copper chaperone CopZ